MAHPASAKFTGTYAHYSMHDIPGSELDEYLGEAVRRLMSQITKQAESEGKIPDWKTLQTSSAPQGDYWVIRASVTARHDPQSMSSRLKKEQAQRDERK